MKKTTVSREEMGNIINEVIKTRKDLLKHLNEYTVNCIASFIDARIKLATSTIREELEEETH